MSEEINPLPVHGGNGSTDLERWITGIKTPALVINPQGRVLFANPCAVQQFNISTDDRVILQEDPTLKREILFLPLSRRIPH